MTAEKLFEVRDSDSEAFVDGDNAYFTHPYSVIDTNLVYGSYCWYTAKLDEVDDRDNWVLMCDSETERVWSTSYFQTVDGQYRSMDPYDGYAGSCKLIKEQGGTPVTLLEADGSRLLQHHTLVVLDTADSAEHQQLTLYDIMGQRTVTVPHTAQWMASALIVGDKLYYSDNARVICYDITSGAMETVFESSTDIAPKLCYDSGSLYIMEYIDSDNDVLHEYSVADASHIRSIPLPYRDGANIVVDGVLFYGNYWLTDVTALDLATGEYFTIPLPGADK